MENLLKLIGFCGVNCETCADYKAERCPGCRADAEAAGDTCFFQRCCRYHEAEHCGMCPEFVCSNILEFAAESEAHQAALERLSELRFGK